MRDMTCAVCGLHAIPINIKYTEDSIDNDRVQGRVQANVRRTSKLVWSNKSQWM